jgi:hypothetical protein
MRGPPTSKMNAGSIKKTNGKSRITELLLDAASCFCVASNLIYFDCRLNKSLIDEPYFSACIRRKRKFLKFPGSVKLTVLLKASVLPIPKSI